jgi:hypothetical protein
LAFLKASPHVEDVSEDDEAEAQSMQRQPRKHHELQGSRTK